MVHFTLKALKAVIYSGTVPRASEPSVSTLPKMFLLGGREEWVDLGVHLWTTKAYSLELEGSQRYAVVLPLSPGTPEWAGPQPAAAVIPGVTQSPLWHDCSVVEPVLSCLFNTSPNSWCLQSSRQRRASNKHDSHSLVGTLNAVSSFSLLLCLPAE